AMQRDFHAWLVDAPSRMPQRVAAGAGLAVYHNAYRVQIAECLKETLEKTVLWLGEEQFFAAARAHVEKTPPHGWTLGVYGDGFDRTLAVLYPDDPEVAELAWLDWALSRAFDGPDADTVLPAALGAMDWDKAVIRLVPTVRIADILTNAGAIWSALSAGETPPAAAPLPMPGAMLAWRQDLTPCFRTIEAAERDALEKVMTGATFGEICADLVGQQGEDAGIQQAGALLGQWLHDGLVRDIA
ncbi:MAG: DUF2063 domain-containing protein, partial [Rubrivivax sp.]